MKVCGADLKIKRQARREREISAVIGAVLNRLNRCGSTSSILDEIQARRTHPGDVRAARTGWLHVCVRVYFREEGMPSWNQLEFSC